MRVFQTIILTCLVLMVWAGSVQPAEEKKAAPAIEIEEATYNFGQITQGEVVKHDFRVFNRGSAPLEIKKVKPG